MIYYPVKDISHYCNVTMNDYGPLSERVIPYYDFSFLLDGEMTYYANGSTIKLKKNDAVFMPPGTLRSRSKGEGTVHFVSFNFTAADAVRFPFPLYIPGCITRDISRLVSLYPPSHLSSFYHSKEKCVNMLNYILFELSESFELKSNNEHVMKILHYIEEHITEDLSLRVISNYMNLSKEYTSHIFKHEMDKTLTAYVNERKLLLAKELINNGEMTLVDIASYLGYENYNYFSRAFKKYLEITPVELKRKCSEKGGCQAKS